MFSSQDHFKITQNRYGDCLADKLYDKIKKALKKPKIKEKDLRGMLEEVQKSKYKDSSSKLATSALKDLDEINGKINEMDDKIKKFQGDPIDKQILYVSHITLLNNKNVYIGEGRNALQNYLDDVDYDKNPKRF